MRDIGDSINVFGLSNTAQGRPNEAEIDADRVRKMWCEVLRNGLIEELAAGDMGRWIGSRDFNEVAHRAGFDGTAIVERLRHHSDVPSALKAISKRLRSKDSVHA